MGIEEAPLPTPYTVRMLRFDPPTELDPLPQLFF